MKNFTKLFGIIALVAAIVFGVAACDDGNDGNKTQYQTYTITWKNWDNSVLETDTNVAKNATPIYNGSLPTRTADAQYTYTFNFWSPTPISVAANATYTATFNQIPIETMTADEAITNAKVAIENADFKLTYTQAENKTQSQIKSDIQSVINGLTTYGTTITITNENWQKAQAGISLSPNGQNGTYTLTISIAKSTGTTQTHSLSITILATQYEKTQAPLAVPTYFQIIMNTAIWNGVPHAEAYYAYTIKINGNEIPVRGNSYSLASLPNGVYTLSVKANGYDTSTTIYTDSEYCIEQTYSIYGNQQAAAPTVTWDAENKLFVITNNEPNATWAKYTFTIDSYPLNLANVIDGVGEYAGKKVYDMSSILAGLDETNDGAIFTFEAQIIAFTDTENFVNYSSNYSSATFIFEYVAPLPPWVGTYEGLNPSDETWLLQFNSNGIGV